MSQQYSVTDDNLTTEMALVCTAAYREAIEKFEEKFDEVESELDENGNNFDKIDELTVIKVWRQALIACKYSSDDIQSLFDDYIGDDEILSQVAEAILIEMGSIATLALKETSMSEDTDISTKAKELIAKIERAQVVEPTINQWINAVWKYLRRRNK